VQQGSRAAGQSRRTAEPLGSSIAVRRTEEQRTAEQWDRGAEGQLGRTVEQQYS